VVRISDKQFASIVSQAIDGIPTPYIDKLENVAFIIEDLPTPTQSQELGLRCNSLLFGLYEGVPLPQRQGTTKLLPDKITLFKKPLETVSQNLGELTKNVKNTVWHEVAHYYGLGHKRIHELEQPK
jgi:predicted Zn-dependent protease with MMP-like domain